jgi:gamma-glutamyl hercynylcysteine S-oxide hydrolase
MCRHLAYLGPPIALRSLLFDAPHSLCEQAARPWHQAAGRVNKDGWGVAWFGPDRTIDDRYYRTTTSMWDDTAFTDGNVESGAFVAAARLASSGASLEPTGNAPFRSDGWLFSLNGYVKDFREGVEGELRAALSPRRRDAIVGDADTEVVFALVLDRLDRGSAPAAALAAAVKRVTALTEAKLNLLLTDGRAMHGTRFGNSLFARASTIVSEPLDETDEWQEIPEGSLVLATASSPGVVRCTAL